MGFGDRVRRTFPRPDLQDLEISGGCGAALDYEVGHCQSFSVHCLPEFSPRHCLFEGPTPFNVSRADVGAHKLQSSQAGWKRCPWGSFFLGDSLCGESSFGKQTLGGENTVSAKLPLPVAFAHA